jgi:cell division protein FtsA
MNVVDLHRRAGQPRAKPAEKSGLVAALDIGSSKICCLIGEVAAPRRPGLGDAPEIRVLGVGHQASRGVRTGAVVDLDAAERAIRLAVDAAERMAGRTATDVYVNVSGGRPRCHNETAEIAIAGDRVTADDVERAIAAAIASADAGRRVIIHATPLQFGLDDARGIADPVGMFGARLWAEVGLLSLEAGMMRNLALVVERCHLSVAGFVAAPYASSRSVLIDDEIALGVTLIEMGGATTSFAAFREGRLVHSDVLPVGGQHITNDIARGLSTTIAHAERMKTLYGSALPSVWDERELLSVPLIGEKGPDAIQKLPRSLLTGIIRPRLEETFELIRERLEGASEVRKAGRRVVLSGGASQLPGVRELASQYLDRHVRLASPRALPGLPEAACTQAFAVPIGLLHYALRPDRQIVPAGRGAGGGEGRGYLVRVGRWIRESF